jgi:hypothetical protein
MRTWMAVAALTTVTLGLGAGTAQAQTGTPTVMVQTWYGKYLGRPIDAVNYYAYTQALQAGAPAYAVEAAILGSPEYYARCGSTPEMFVIALYRDVLGTTPLPQDVTYWAQQAALSGRPAVAARLMLLRPAVVVPMPGTAVPPVVPVTATPPLAMVVPTYTVEVPAVASPWMPPAVYGVQFRFTK